MTCCDQLPKLPENCWHAFELFPRSLSTKIENVSYQIETSGDYPTLE